MDKIKIVINNKWFWPMLSVMILLLVTVFVFFGSLNNFSGKKKSENTSFEIVTETKKKEAVQGNELFSDYLVAVAIDNYPGVRQYGLDGAKLVYEVEVEGGLTRYLAFFGKNNIDKIGPVRSARSYLVDLAVGEAVAMVHCGGSPAALSDLSRRGFFNFDEFYNGSYFWRDKNSTAPHNVFTSADKIASYVTVKKIKNEQKNRVSTEKAGSAIDSDVGRKVSKLVVSRSGGRKIEWVYDQDKKVYFRMNNASFYVTGDNKKPEVKRLFFDFAKSKVIDQELRLDIKLIGQGDSIYCFEGLCQNVVWKKNGADYPSLHYYDNSEILKIGDGLTWVEILNSRANISEIN